MRYVAAYLLAVLGGNDSPSSKDLKKILDSVGIETDDERVNKAGFYKLQTANAFSKDQFRVTITIPPMKQDGTGFVTQHSENFLFPKAGTVREKLKRSKLASYTQPVIGELNGKNIEDVIAQGNSKLASMPAGGAVAVSSGGSAAPVGGPAPAAAEEKKEEKKEESEESDDDMGFGLFD